LSAFSRYALLKFKVAVRKILTLYDKRVTYLVPEHFKVAPALSFVRIEKDVLETIHIGLDALGRVIGHPFPRFLLLTLNRPLHFGRCLQFGIFEV